MAEAQLLLGKEVARWGTCSLIITAIFGHNIIVIL